MITLYQQHDSGNCYKVRLLLTHLGLPIRTVGVSSLQTRALHWLYLEKCLDVGVHQHKV